MGSLRAAYNYVTKDESFRAVLPVYVCFFFISVSMYGGSNIQVIVLDSAGTHINGYTSMTLYWSLSTPSPLMLPILVQYVSIRKLMILWSVGYTILSAMLIYPIVSVVYVCSTLSGFAAALAPPTASILIATVSKKFNGSEAKLSGLFYLFQMASVLVCNIIVYFAFKGKSEIDDHTRYAVTIPLTAIGVFGTLLVIFVNKDKCSIKPISRDVSGKQKMKPSKLGSNISKQTRALRDMILTLKDWKALCLYSTGVFLGMECGFWMGVAQTAVGNSLYIENSKEIMGVMGFFVGIGEIVASFLYTGLTSSRKDNGIFSWISMATGLMGYFILYLVLPPEANIRRTYSMPYYHQHTLPLLIAAGALIGASDYFVNAQFTSVFCKVYRYKDSTPYFSVQFLLSGVGGTLLYYTGDKIQLNFQLLVLSVLTVEAAFVFMFFDIFSTPKKRSVRVAEKETLLKLAI